MSKESYGQTTVTFNFLPNHSEFLLLPIVFTFQVVSMFVDSCLCKVNSSTVEWLVYICNQDKNAVLWFFAHYQRKQQIKNFPYHCDMTCPSKHVYNWLRFTSRERKLGFFKEQSTLGSEWNYILKMIRMSYFLIFSFCQNSGTLTLFIPWGTHTL